jgi:hypothetical protein
MEVVQKDRVPAGSCPQGREAAQGAAPPSICMSQNEHVFPLAFRSRPYSGTCSARDATRSCSNRTNRARLACKRLSRLADYWHRLVLRPHHTRRKGGRSHRGKEDASSHLGPRRVQIFVQCSIHHTPPRPACPNQRVAAGEPSPLLLAQSGRQARASGVRRGQSRHQPKVH